MSRFMARKLRIQYPGAIYHLMNLADHPERVFCDDDDRQMFLGTLAEGCDKTGWQIHTYCLMTNHLHPVIETPNANLVEGMKWLLGPTPPPATGVAASGSVHGRVGHPLLQGGTAC